MAESSSPRPLLSPHARLRWDERAGQTILLAPERGLLLDEVATAVVRLCDGTRTVADIARVLQASYPDASIDAIARDVEYLISALAVRGLVR